MTFPSQGYPDWSRESHQGGVLLGSWTIANGTVTASPVFYCAEFPFIVVTVKSASINHNLVVFPTFGTNQNFTTLYFGGTQWFAGNQDCSMYFLTRGAFVYFQTQFWDAPFTGNITLNAFGISQLPECSGIGNGLAPIFNTSDALASGGSATHAPNGSFSGSILLAVTGNQNGSANAQLQVQGYNGGGFSTYQFINLAAVNTTVNGEFVIPNIPWQLFVKNNNAAAQTIICLAMPKSIFVG